MTTLPTDPPEPSALPRTDPTAREVALLAGVSLSTVSRAFRNSPLVNPETHRKVREAAEKVGYRPSNFARSLRTGVSSTVGFLLRRPTGLLGEFHAKAFGAIEERLASLDLQPLVTAVPESLPLLEYARQMLAQEALCGILVQGDNLTAAQVMELAEFPRATVLLNYSEPIPDSPHLAAAGFDNQMGIEQAARHVVALGHHRIAFIGGSPETNDARLREAGFRRSLLATGVPVREEFIRAGDFGRLHGGFKSGAGEMEYLLSLRTRPTAVIAASDEIAVGAIDTARRCGLSVPADISIVGYDNHSWSPFLNPPLTTIEHDGWQLGEVAGGLLAGLMQRAETAQRAVLLPSHLIARGSSGRAPGD